jgi:hypothetical protein
MKFKRASVCCCLFMLMATMLAASGVAQAQRGQAGRGQVPATPRAAAPVDLTGYWVSIVSEDWRWRMGVGPKGDFGYVPLNAEGRKLGESWNPVQDEATGSPCKSYGAPGIMRQPGRFHITWENDTTMKIEADAGMQVRMLPFGESTPSGAPSLQGNSAAAWQVSGGRGGIPRSGQLKVVTTNVVPGYYFKHGIPYSGRTSMTEYFARLNDEDGQSYLAITTIVEDPQYLTQPFFRTLQFKLEPNGSKWNPTPCSVR